LIEKLEQEKIPIEERENHPKLMEFTKFHELSDKVNNEFNRTVY